MRAAHVPDDPSAAPSGGPHARRPGRGAPWRRRACGAALSAQGRAVLAVVIAVLFALAPVGPVVRSVVEVDAALVQLVSALETIAVETVRTWAALRIRAIAHGAGAR